MSNLLTFPRHPKQQYQEPPLRLAIHSIMVCSVGSAADVALQEHVFKKSFRDAMWREHGARILSKTIRLHYTEAHDASAPDPCRDHSHLLLVGYAPLPQVLP